MCTNWKSNFSLPKSVCIVAGSRRPEHSFFTSPAVITASENLSKDRDEVPVNEHHDVVYILTSQSTIEIILLEYKMQLYQGLAAKVSFYHYNIEQSWEMVKMFFTHTWAPSPSQRFLPPCSDMPADLIADTNSIQWKPGQKYIFKKVTSVGHHSVDARSERKRRHRQK